MAPAPFKSRRSAAPADETSRVAEAVWAYYEAGRRPPTTPVVSWDEVDQPADEAVDTAEAVESHEPSGLDEAIVTASGQTLEELAEELEALIDSIRYGADPS